ncbi:putative protein indeterminate-domain 1 [Iris pallida]|uniref:Protein EARLY HEADING DATE 2 n=1 Tax=Iris pallida TaxID=29817 RepID=A0AAX6EW71_IRIPA|nr:putative protein indeterminate-domain 1 [Iris pallida]
MPIESENSAGDASASSDRQPPPPPPPPAAKKKRNLPGMPDPDSEVIALSPKTLMATNRFVCEICNKGFQRDQNLQLHRRGHNLPWKLRQRNANEVRKRVYVCPEPGCVHHDPSRALGDLTGIKKHFSRKHGEKKWKCDKCSKKYAVQSDWKAHSKTCGTREYRCDCGTLFSRRDSFITHRAFCDALTEECAKTQTTATAKTNSASEEETTDLAAEPAVMPTAIASMERQESEEAAAGMMMHYLPPPSADGGGATSGAGGNATATSIFASLFSSAASTSVAGGQGASFSEPTSLCLFSAPPTAHQFAAAAAPQQQPSPHMSATALLQKAAQMGATTSGGSSFLRGFGLAPSSSSAGQQEDGGLQWGIHSHHQALDAGLGLGLAYDSGGLMMGPKLATLDLLGIGPGGASAGGFSALMSSMGGGGGGLDVGPGTSPTSWEGADRKPALL